jgi:hypothetical protein
MVVLDSTGLLPSMPNGLTFMAMRPLIIPLAIVSLGIGFVLWRFMGDIPSVLGIGLNVLVDSLRPGQGKPASPVRAPIVYPVDAGIDAIRAIDPGFSTPSFITEVQRIGTLVVAGWAKRDLTDCRSLMTDACWELQRAQLGWPVADGWRPIATSATANLESILSVRSDAATDRITVRARIKCPPGTAKLVRGRRIGEWTEDWTVVRTRPSAAAVGWRFDAMSHVAVHFERAA